MQTKISNSQFKLCDELIEYSISATKNYKEKDEQKLTFSQYIFH